MRLVTAMRERWSPAVLAAPSMLGHHLDQPHPIWHPPWEWLGQPALAVCFVAGTVTALLGLALAAALHPRRRRYPAV